MLQQETYNQSDYYIRANMSYESPLLILSWLPYVGKYMEMERINVSTLDVKGELLLAIAGIMSDDTLINVNRDLENAKKAAYDLGVSTGIDPFMTLSFMALPVIPSLRITTRGVFDVTTQRYV